MSLIGQKLLSLDVNKIEKNDVNVYLILKRSISRVLSFTHGKKKLSAYWLLRIK